MKRFPAAVCAWLVAGAVAGRAEDALRLITLAPGHFHAALIQKDMLPGVSEEVSVYGPLGADLTAHLNRIAQFNSRADRPTRWKLSIYAGADYWEKLLAAMPGNVVVVSGVNRGKVERLRALVGKKAHVLADKPWIVEAEDLPALAGVLEAAGRENVVAYDGMTQRFEISCLLQRALVNDAAVFGSPETGSAAEPGVRMESVHYLLKLVAGVPNLRPAWFFDIRQQGEPLADVGTHLADLVQWTLFPEQAIDVQRDIRILAAARAPILLSRAEFERVTGERGFPEFLADSVSGDTLRYYGDNSVDYTLRGIHTRLDVKWAFAAPDGGGDTELAIFRGSKSRIEVRQGKQENYRPEVYVVPARPGLKSEVAAAVERRLAALGEAWPGLAAQDQGERIRIVIPERFRIGHEAHFALLAQTFLGYVRNPRTLPAWEKPNMLAKYYVTTSGVALARRTETR